MLYSMCRQKGSGQQFDNDNESSISPRKGSHKIFVKKSKHQMLKIIKMHTAQNSCKPFKRCMNQT